MHSGLPLPEATNILPEAIYEHLSRRQVNEELEDLDDLQIMI